MKFTIFLSSRNNDRTVINGKNGDTLTEIRKYLKKELENEKFFDKDFIELKINEDFAADTSMGSYQRCLAEVRDSDFFIAIYNGSAGWAPEGVDLGICHAELEAALNISTRKTAIIDMSKYFVLNGLDNFEKKRNKNFKNFLTTLDPFSNPLKLAVKNQNNDGFKQELINLIKNIIFKHIEDRLKLANTYYNIGGNRLLSLNWKKLKYSDRDKNIKSILETLLKESPDFANFTCRAFSIPDNMSVEDAKAFAGRPFLNDHDTIKIPAEGEDAKYGPIHFIGVYGNATERQVKNLIGFPDISAIKDDFGFYVWEQNTHIQLVFLSECKTPASVKSKFILFNNWCRSNLEYDKIIKRAEARFHILKSIIEAKQIAKA